MDMATQEVTLADLIWNRDGQFNYIWNDPNAEPILEQIYLNENSCKECFTSGAQNELGLVPSPVDGEFYSIRVCNRCLPTTRGFDALKNLLFKE
jgi:hypothetical protein